MKRNAFTGVIAVFLAALLLLGALPISSTALNAELSGDEDSGYYLNMQNIANLVTVDLTGRKDGFTFKVYDDGGKDGDYGNNYENCYVFTAPEKFAVTVSGSGVTESSSYDWLTLYDGDTETVLGEERYGGSFTLPELTTSGNVLKIRFKADSSISASGFELTVTLVDHSDFARVSYAFGESVKTYSVKKGTSTELKTFASMFTLPDRQIFSFWQNGEQTYAEGADFTVTEDVTFTAVFEVEPVILSDAEDGYYSKIPKTGTITADLSDREAGFTLRVYDHAGKNGNYADNSDGYLLVTAPENTVLSVSGSGVTERNCDWLTVYDGDTQTALGNYSGNFTLPELFTGGSVLKIRFFSDGGVRNSGVSLTVKIVDPSSIVNVTYKNGAETVTKKASQGSEIALPTFTDAGFAKLPYRKAFKQWRCENDGNAYAIAHRVTVNENMTFTAEFDDLPILIDDGEGGSYALVPENEQATLELSDKPNGFSLKLYDYKGKNGYYSNDCDGALTVVAPTGYILVVEGSVSTDWYEYDYLIFTDTDGETVLGSGVNSTGRYGGYFTVPALTSTGNRLTVRFVSDGGIYDNGFDLTVSMFDPATLVTVTFEPGRGSGTMNGMRVISGEPFVLPASGFYAPADEQFLYYTDGVNVYPAGETAVFDADTTLTALYADAVRLTYANGDGNDYELSVATGSRITLPEYETYENYLGWIPAKMQFLGWRERSSETVYQPGDTYTVVGGATFDAVVELIPLLVSDGEGGWYVNMPARSDTDTVDLTDRSAGFTFKLYDDGGKNKDYSASFEEYLVILAPAGCILKVAGSGKTERISWGADYLKFFDGADSSCAQLGSARYDGEFTVDGMTSSGAALTVCFRSDYSVVKEGFELTVTVVEAATLTYVYGDTDKTVSVEKNAEAALAGFETLFALPDDLEFVCWRNGEQTFAEGETITVSGNTTLTAELRKRPVVTVDGNGAVLADGSGGTQYVFAVFTGTEEELPHAKMLFEIPADKVFGGWSIDGAVYEIGAVYAVTKDVTVTAIWNDLSPWDVLARDLKTASGTVILTEDLVGSSGSEILTVPAGVTVTVDLAGHRIDGTKTAAANGALMLDVRGNLTLVDSVGGGVITGGGMQVLTTATLSADAVMGQFGAAYAKDYSLIDESDDSRLDGRYAIVYYPTLYEAFTAAADYDQNFKEEIPHATESGYYFGYNDAYVIMLADATVAEGEVWTVDSFLSIWFDLNGHTLDIRGTFTCSDVFMTDIHLVSTVPGVFRSSGVVEVGFQFVRAGDTYFFTGGEITNFFAYAGTFHITGGTFTNCRFENYFEGQDLTVNISGTPVFDHLSVQVWAGEDEGDFAMIVNGTPRFTEFGFRLGGDRFTEKTCLFLNGGYFDADPDATFCEYNDYFVSYGVQRYSGQSD